jgi:hypothetical protein
MRKMRMTNKPLLTGDYTIACPLRDVKRFFMFIFRNRVDKIPDQVIQ